MGWLNLSPNFSPLSAFIRLWPTATFAFETAFFPPHLTLWLFLAQCLSPDPTLRNALAGLLAFWPVSSRKLPSSKTGGYSRARSRLSLRVLRDLLHDAGARLEARVRHSELWLGRRVRIADGTCVSMPDTPANQRIFPQPRSQKKGCGFPLSRLVVLFSLCSGAVLGAHIGSFFTCENTLLSKLLKGLAPNDVLLCDRFYCIFSNFARLMRRKVDLVIRQHAARLAAIRKLKRLGPGDYLVEWTRSARKAKRFSAAQWNALPEKLLLRQVALRVRVKGFRTRKITILTTLLDPNKYPAHALAELYRLRWHAELSLRDLKSTLQMDILRGKTPRMVKKEILGRLLAYTLLRTLIHAACRKLHAHFSRISFKGALQHFLNALPCLRCADAKTAEQLFHRLLHLLSRELLPNRPERFEPRAKKRRPKAYPLLTRPRCILKALMAHYPPRLSK